MRILIIGAGGHGAVVADALLAQRAAGQALEPIGFLDANPGLAGSFRMGLPVLGTDADLAATPHDAVIVAIGDNALRQTMHAHLKRCGETFATAIHPSAVIAPDVRIAPGCMVMARVVVNPGAVVEADCILNTGCIVEHGCRIGPHAHIAPGAVLGGGCRVDEGALVGIGATVLPGMSVGARAVIGAGGVAVSDVPDQTTAVGVPARPRD